MPLRYSADIMKIPYKHTLQNKFDNIKAPLWPAFSIFNKMMYRKEDITASIENKNIFFILSTGRSGTQFLSNLLNTIDDKSMVLHEPDFHYDVKVMEKSRKSREYAFNYIDRFKKIAIYKRINANNVMRYGEVTGTLRYHVEALQKVFPKAKIILMAKDGRDVVRSIMGWPQFYAKGSKGAYNLKPLPSEHYYGQWPEMTRFEKLSWLWMHSYELMLKFIPSENIIHFEQLVNNFEYFKMKIADKVGIAIKEPEWLEAVKQKSPNATKRYAFPHWTQWPEDYKKAFDTICGPTMKKLGYDI